MARIIDFIMNRDATSGDPHVGKICTQVNGEKRTLHTLYVIARKRYSIFYL